ncbi:hypothetical protein WQQ_38470 [Hydrocarboniphaga effusa AP103]|uniref:Uncharacterized protein n=1 Tax=Hydrocarboniphaga effusa AP103 TaxID=1172194 RepID=I7ZAF8_9GAMM|nr:hypothetical protein WQQ_38470 [Hydrocarboniphaga effusa AP103]
MSHGRALDHRSPRLSRERRHLLRNRDEVKAQHAVDHRPAPRCRAGPVRCGWQWL